MFNNFELEIVRIIKSKHPNIGDDEIKEWMDSTQYWTTWNKTHSQLWIDEFVRMMQGRKDMIAVHRFFILVYGIIIDLADHIDGQLKSLIKQAEIENVELFDFIQNNFTGNLTMKGALLGLSNVRDVLKDFSDLISDDLEFKITFFRNTLSHPTLNGYSVKMRKGPKMFDAKNYGVVLKLAELDMLEVFEEAYDIFISNIPALKLLQYTINK